MDRRGGAVRRPLGIFAAVDRAATDVSISRLGTQSDRCLHSRQARRERSDPLARGRSADAHRRLYLDVLGLLPTPEEVTQFVDDRDPRAYELLVERVLASPHYGERWGRHWLDQARYADSNGYALDAEREMWPYRDWVIRALNDDLPFDRFTIEQLAGDLLPEPKKEQLLATAFHRNTLINLEGGSDPEQFRVEAVMDRVNTTGAVWLGLTVGCAQCHSHKFDPITQREYYQLLAFFNSSDDVNDRGPTVQYTRGELIGPPPGPRPEPPPENPDALAERRDVGAGGIGPARIGGRRARRCRHFRRAAAGRLVAGSL